MEMQVLEVAAGAAEGSADRGGDACANSTLPSSASTAQAMGGPLVLVAPESSTGIATSKATYEKAWQHPIFIGTSIVWLVIVVRYPSARLRKAH
jgi:hypothetical protein